MLELDPDVVLLQEVSGLPKTITDRYAIVQRPAAGKAGGPQTFRTAVASKLPIVSEIPMQTPNGWVREQADFFSGNLIALSLLHPVRGRINVVSVYSPAWAIQRAKWRDVDVSDLKLSSNPDIWCTEILWDLLRHSMAGSAGGWIVGGDFNSSETFDFRPAGDRGNREIIARLNALGLVEALRNKSGRLVPTFRNTGSTAVLHQLDHLYVAKDILELLTRCETGDSERVFGSNLSDHLPIIAEFKIDDN